MKNLFYRFHTSFDFNYGIDPILDKALRDCMDRGLKKIISISDNRGEVEFNDGTKYFFSNSGRYNSWLDRGDFVFATGLTYHYSCKRPTVKTMYLFKKVLDNFNFCPVDDSLNIGNKEPFLK